MHHHSDDPGAEPRPQHLPIDPDLDGPDEVVLGAPSLEHWDVAVVVGAGGALGGLARYALGRLLPGGGGFPWATFTENVVGCLLLGAVMVWLVEVRAPSRYARPFLGVGVLGGFTTFSTYTTEIRTLFVDGRAALGLGYLAGSVLAGLLATLVGIAIVRRLVRPASAEDVAEEAV